MNNCNIISVYFIGDKVFSRYITETSMCEYTVRSTIRVLNSLGDYAKHFTTKKKNNVMEIVFKILTT